MKFKSILFGCHKIIHWEYWPQWLVYAPIIPAYLYYAIKSKALFFFNATNPTMENGGYLMESKYTIYKALPSYSIPVTALATLGISFKEVLQLMHANNLHYPIICKPDIGGKGLGVEMIKNETELLHYYTVSPISFLIQAYINYSNEVGIFYYRKPNEKNGFISGIVGKYNMEVVGNGSSTLQQLIEATPRFYFQRNYLFKILKDTLQTIVPVHATVVLSTIGNHARGSMFKDMSFKITPQLQYLIDDISKKYEGFYYGRYDIKFNSWEELEAGKNFSIIELNGAGSEPTHIYDPNNSIFKAWKVILQHWKISYQIAAINVTLGATTFTIKEGLSLIKQQKQLNKKINTAFYM